LHRQGLKYDDAVNGIIPDPPIVQSTLIGGVRSRSVPLLLFGSVIVANHYMHGQNSDDSRTLWNLYTYVPRDLVLVKGPTRKWNTGESDKAIVEVLVLTRTDSPGCETRRVEVSKFRSCDVAVESLKNLTVIRASPSVDALHFVVASKSSTSTRHYSSKWRLHVAACCG
jgi:hypothetical protein